MLSQSGGRRVLQKMLTFEYRGASAMRSPLVKGTPFVLQQSRTARSKRPNDFYTNAQRQDERLLKRLEAQLVNAKAKLKREEEAALAHYKRQMEARKGGKGKASAKDDSAFFFKSMLTRMDRAKLAMHGIWNFNELYYAYTEADVLMKRPPFPKLEDLGGKHRIAYEMYNKIPETVADSTPWGPDHSGV
ncbi:hypothetical protein J132_08572 [Termitomyces sp. J132]|nr:hypothetical protein H2248_006219 [Termitomyces sp. 'cryptogamus']KNZ79914.1 hypothetical protein J132_08572 [Termitomyces sp. J132]